MMLINAVAWQILNTYLLIISKYKAHRCVMQLWMVYKTLYGFTKPYNAVVDGLQKIAKINTRS